MRDHSTRPATPRPASARGHPASVDPDTVDPASVEAAGADAAGADAAAGRLLGVGVEHYVSPRLPRLPKAGTDVTKLRDLLKSFRAAVADQTDEVALRAFLRSARTSLAGTGPVVAVWCGHGVRSPHGQLRLLASDSEDFDADGIDVAAFMAACVALGASQLLVIVDTCHSGGGVMSAVDVATALLQARPPDAEHVWVGVLASAQPAETARDGALGQVLQDLIRHGPSEAVLQQVLWSRQSRMIRGDVLCDAALKQWTHHAHRPVFVSSGSAWFMLPNPLWAGGAAPGVVEHLLLAARAGASDAEPPAFTGRQIEVDTVVGWVTSRQPGLRVVTGLAGTGKSAVVGRVVSLSDPQERRRILASGRALHHLDPGEHSVDAHVHARGLNADRMAELLSGQLVARALLAPTPTGRARNAALLAGELQQHAGEPPVIVVDGLDEARGEVFGITEDLLLRIADSATVVVASREVRGPRNEPSLLSRLDPAGGRLDLSSPVAAARGEADLRDYVTARLQGVSAAMDAAEVARHFVAHVQRDRPFLLARIVTDSLRAAPVDTTRQGWQAEVATSLRAAFAADLSSLTPPAHRTAASQPTPTGLATPTARVSAPAGEGPFPESPPVAALATSLLTALTWGYGAGLPIEEWLAVANATFDGPAPDDQDPGDPAGGRPFSTLDLLWLLDGAGRYVVQDGEGEVAVYRLAHQSIADLLRPRFTASKDQLFDPEALPVAAALVTRYDDLLSRGVAARGPAYLWRYALRHAAAAGPAGVAVFRPLAQREPALRTDLALACLDITGRLLFWGRAGEAAEPVEESVQLLREQAATGEDVGRELGVALNHASIVHLQTGQSRRAIELAREGVQLYRRLSAAEPAHRGELALGLTNLALWLTSLERFEEAEPFVEEAVAVYRDLSTTSSAERPGLARALAVLSTCREAHADPREALRLATEAVSIYRELATAGEPVNPVMPAALTRLAGAQLGVGQRDAALRTTLESVELTRRLASVNPVFVPDLATALASAALSYAGLGRTTEALAAAEESLGLQRSLAGGSPAHVVEVTRLLNIHGQLLSAVGRTAEAVAALEESVELARGLAAEHPSFTPVLARALTNRGARRAELGDIGAALADMAEGIAMFRGVCRARPAHAPELASALSSLSVAHMAAGNNDEAVTSGQEAVQLYRSAAAANAAHEPELARAMTNLGSALVAGGDTTDGAVLLQEAVNLNRDLLARRGAVQVELARTLTNLAIAHGADLEQADPDRRPAESARKGDGGAAADVAILQEAAAIYRERPPGHPLMRFELHRTLTVLGERLVAVGRGENAVAAWQEAVELQRLTADDAAGAAQLGADLVGLAHAHLAADELTGARSAADEAVELLEHSLRAGLDVAQLLARALRCLEHQDRRPAQQQGQDQAAEQGRQGSADPARGLLSPREADRRWDATLALLTAEQQADLLVARAELGGTDSQAGAWLARAAMMQPTSRDLVHRLHEQVRRHRSPGFDAAWMSSGAGPLPDWALVAPEDVAAADAWLSEPTYVAERDHLLARPELLTARYDGPFEEALLQWSQRFAARARATRARARAHGVAAAYEELVAGELASRFVAADIAEQAQLLATRREELLGEAVLERIDASASQEGPGDGSQGQQEPGDRDRAGHAVTDAATVPAHFAAALLRLARRGADARVFAALQERAGASAALERLLREVAAEHAGEPLLDLANLVGSYAQRWGEPDLEATAYFFAGCAIAATDPDVADQLVADALSRRPDQQHDWLQVAIALVDTTPAAARLVKVLVSAPTRGMVAGTGARDETARHTDPQAGSEPRP